MRRVNYVAKGPHGTIQGTQEAASASSLASDLQAKGLVPLKITPDGPVTAGNAGSAASGAMATPEFMKPKILPMDVMMFAKQLYTLFKAGVPILRALAGLQETTQNPTLKDVLLDLRRNLEGWVELSACMAQHPKAFD